MTQKGRREVTGEIPRVREKGTLASRVRWQDQKGQMMPCIRSERKEISTDAGGWW